MSLYTEHAGECELVKSNVLQLCRDVRHKNHHLCASYGAEEVGWGGEVGFLYIVFFHIIIQQDEA